MSQVESTPCLTKMNKDKLLHAAQKMNKELNDYKANPVPNMSNAVKNLTRKIRDLESTLKKQMTDFTMLKLL